MAEAVRTPSLADVLVAPKSKPLVGVIHLPLLAGPDSLPLDALMQRVEDDARAYSEAGFDAVMVENYGDAPYPKAESPPHVAAVLGRAVARARNVTGIAVGVNVLRNDTCSALAAAYAGGGSFVRANVYTGVTVTDQGLIEGNAAEVVRYRRELGIERGPDRVLVLADIDVKHGAPLVARPLDDVAAEMVYRARADVLLVTGTATGRPADFADVERAARGAPGIPIWIASGVTDKTMDEILKVADGAIVGTAAKQGGSVKAPVDPERARKIAKAAGKERRA